MIQKTLPTGKTVNAFPLTIPQQFMLGVSIQYGKGFNVNNIGSGYYFKANMDFDVMKESIYEAISRCDTMRLRFMPDEQFKVLQYVEDKTGIEIGTLDFSDLSEEEADKKLLEQTRGDVPLFFEEIHRIWLVKLADGYNGILMKIHHLAMDAYSVKIFLKDIMEIYLSKTQGTAYPKPMRPYYPEAMKELAYINSEKHEKERQYWYSTLADNSEPVFTDYLLDNRMKKQREKYPERRYCDIHSGSPEAGLLKFSLTAEETDSIMAMCKKKELSVCAALSMGIRTALSVFNDNEQDVSFKMIINRRGTIGEKKSGGLRIGTFPTRSIVSPEDTFVTAVEKITDDQNKMYQHCSLGFMEMLALRHKSMPETALPDSTYDSVGFSYQPLMIIPNINDEIAKTAKGVWYNNGASMIPVYITARHRANDGGLDFVFEYRKEPYPVEDLKIFFNKIKIALLAGAENPDVKVGEILKKAELTESERKN